MPHRDEPAFPVGSEPAGDEPSRPTRPPGDEEAGAVDSPAEVDAVFRTQRRVSVGYALLFALLLASVSVFTVGLAWWTTGRILGGISPGFLMAAFGLYLVFVALAAAACSLASAIENRMLGSADDLWHDPAEPSDGRAGTRPRTLHGRLSDDGHRQGGGG